jgi:surface polysaccharide O-acyltransferase-like enzyme
MSRNKSLDLIRGAAIFFVVLNHSAELFYKLNSTEEILPVMGIVSFTVGRLGVPLFFLLSGYLLLTRNYHDYPDCVSFWKNKFGLLLLNWEIWTLIYYIFLAFLGWYPLFDIKSFSNLLKQICFMQFVPLLHTWYVPTLLGLYFFYPIVARALQQSQKKELMILLAFTYIPSFALQTLEIITRGQNVLSKGFSGGGCGFLIVLGYMLYNHFIPCFSRLKCVLYFLLAFGLTVGFQIFLRLHGQIYIVNYDFVTVPFTACFLFLFLSQINISDRIENILVRLSTAAYGIYLIHMPVMLLIIDIIRPMFRRSIGMLVCDLVVFFTSWAIIELVRRVPKVRKYLVLIK